jgi:hypothetical protein
VSFLDDKGRPSVTERVFVLPPGSQIGPITPEQRKALIASLVAGVYEKRWTASRPTKSSRAAPTARPTHPVAPLAQFARNHPARRQARGGVLGSGMGGMLNDMLFGTTGPRGAKHDGLVQTMAKSAVRTMGTSVGKEILRGVLGGIFGSKKR